MRHLASNVRSAFCSIIEISNLLIFLFGVVIHNGIVKNWECTHFYLVCTYKLPTCKLHFICENFRDVQRSLDVLSRWGKFSSCFVHSSNNSLANFIKVKKLSVVMFLPFLTYDAVSFNTTWSTHLCRGSCNSILPLPKCSIAF